MGEWMDGVDGRGRIWKGNTAGKGEGEGKLNGSVIDRR